ncbi:nrap protein [Microdochium trichocladiopsis]|uniref:U3 small nucleolar RNA-associated protein 22 n=1 Tax=Microdochium trichocladiopsis TaxID=1682393 RepID=A0A9P8XVV7_9PEZI|nr:nrap protein [Microdochium trichocladiopsis]KAH7018291.1 nrap protein [Microdochium trichocladiopsis]
MEQSSAKRRKLEHGNAPLSLDNATSSGMGAAGATAFIMETEELLKEIKIDYASTLPGADDELRRFKEAIESLTPHEPTPIHDAAAKLDKSGKTAVPFPDPKPAKDSPYKVAFEKPSQVNVVGSYTLKTMVKSQQNPAVDMIVVMPASIFQEKDYLNMRYFYKRAYYIAYIAEGLSQSLSGTGEFTYELLNGNPLLPVLRATIKGKAVYSIRIIPTAPEGLFPAKKLGAASSSLRQGETKESNNAKTASPFYNSTLKAEALYTPYLRVLHKSSKSSAAFADACLLGRTWLQQRGFGGSLAEGGFGHFEWAALIALLLQGGGRKGEAVLSVSLHSTQLFKATLQYLATANFLKKPVIIGGDAPDLDSIRQTGPVLYDGVRNMNILYKMTPWSAAMLVEQAKWSLEAINGSPRDQFDPLFITKVNQPLQMFDILLRITVPSSKELIPRTSDCKGVVMDYSEKVYQVLRKALGERATQIHIELSKVTNSWSTSGSAPKHKNRSLLVGISIDSAKASQVREFGPSHEEKKDAAKFRDFWGDKAELWQFPDGNIVESLDWTAYGHLGYTGITEAIIRYILKLRLHVDDSNVSFCVEEFNSIVTFAPSDKAAYTAARQAFENLERDIRGLDDLPLHVKQVAAIAPELRSTSLRVPESDPRKLAQPMGVVISFEASGKWPENLAAIQRAKIAFLLKIGSSLEEHNEGVIKTHLGLEDAQTDVENLAFLDIVYAASGIAFRLRVQSDLEDTLLERKTKDKTLERHERTEASELLAAARLKYTVLPLHNQTVATFCTRLAALSPAIRLVKQWFSSHKLSCHFSEELIELFTLQAFLRPHPWKMPSSAMTGFLRTLHLLSRWDWRDEALVVDSAESLSAAQRAEISTRFEAWRKIDPNMNRTTLFVATSQDASGTAYTASGPSKVVAARMTSLARSACRLVKERGADLDARSLFQTSLRDYDIVLHLSPKVIRAMQRPEGARASVFKNLDALTTSSKADALPLLKAPARSLLDELNATFSGPLLFFHGAPDEDNVIAALWNPQLHKRAFSIHMPCSFRPVAGGGDGDEKQMYEVNKQAITAEIARIGGDVIDRIEVKAA